MRAVEEKMVQALKLMGETIEGYAKDDCPVDTGLLHNSLTYGVSGSSMNQTSYTDNSGTQSGSYQSNAPGTAKDHAVYVGSNVEYAPYVEFMSMNHQVGKAHFLRDAGVNHIDELRDKAQKVFNTL